MAVFGKQRDHLHAKHLNPETVSFSIFTNEDIKKLCVTKIITPLTFDPLGFPLAGGLHDTSLGPASERGDPCTTCLKNVYECPGHYGYIELPMPVVNPLFHKIIAALLKKACLNCHKMQVPDHIKHIIFFQMKLLKMGRLSEAADIESRILELISKYEHFETIPEEELATLNTDHLEIGEADYEDSLSKSTELLKNQFIRNVFDRIQANKMCMHCRRSHDKITTVKNKLFITTRQRLQKNTSSEIKALLTKHINPEDSRQHLRKIWKNERELLRHIIPLLDRLDCEEPTDVFFMDIIPVTPTNVRPVNMSDGRISEHAQTKLYKTILQDALLLRAIIKVVQGNGEADVLSDAAKAAYLLVKGGQPIEKLNTIWENLQHSADGLIDTDEKGTGGQQGLKQVIEKKEGIIRKHMMGKRVDFAARSVITPDPNLNIDEIGVPEEFAKHLTYPVPVTSWNVEELRKLIMNGPNVHPGAVTVEFEDGKVNRISAKDATQQESILKRLLTPDGPDKGFRGIKMVHRHLCNGDVLLLNRQPTLHKPSIMAHTARVLKGEKTLRLHYANCKAYNADFDGDEMNAHFPQNELSRSEAYTIANVSNQYLVPKDGTPLSGLIQDHMISGVRLSIRGKFFNRIDYQQLVYQGLSFKLSRIKLLPPAILKPARLWSGKQILSTIILNIIPTGKVAINLLATSKISTRAWETAKPRRWKAGGKHFSNENVMSEAEVVIRQGELLCGILDKSHYGATPYSLVHCMYELYGGSCAIKLLSSLAKLFTCFLQMEGFTLGVHDILVLTEADKKRDVIIKNSRQIGDEVITLALNIPANSTSEMIVEKLEEQSASNAKTRAIIDRQYKTSLDSYTNDINKTCIPAGLICKFPDNNLQLMVQSGAKGSTVNTMQISCLLGQIELEGKRPPVMISGKSLPSFPNHEFAPRAGGFIDGRFMTGIQPQEFFFHCMAGREGLIDTAVKTSRSGYLQRCLIKHLEGLHVGYDLTVRDSDKSVVQFCYGEDGMDISKVQFLNEQQLSFLVDNYKAVVDDKVAGSLVNPMEQKLLLKHSKRLIKWRKEHNWDGARCIPSPFSLFSLKVKDKVTLKDSSAVNPKTGRDKKTKFICELWQQADSGIKDSFQSLCKPCPEPMVAKYQPDCYFGSLNERLVALVDDFSDKENHSKNTKKMLKKLISLKAMQSLCAPGEPVGLLAAQSIGEPSTQMTLNTFHFAGRGEMNVTLGIPRLREILMVASKNIKTPSMEVPFLKVPQLQAKAEKLRKILTKVVVADILEKIDVEQEIIFRPQRREKIILKFYFMPYDLYKSDCNVKPSRILRYMSDKFFKLMFLAIQKYAKVHINVVSLEDDRKERFKATEKEDEDAPDEAPEKTGDNENADEVSSDEEVPEDPEDAKGGTRYNQLCDDQAPELEEEPEDANMSDKEDEVQPKKNDEEEEDSEELTAQEIKSIRTAVLQTHQHAHSFTFDTKNYSWCELSFFLPISSKNIDMTAILKETAAKAVLWETPGIRRAFILENNDLLLLKTDGINLVEMFKYNRLLDLNKLYSNDIHKIAETYGIEAAMRVIVQEVRDVFKVYGITVDPRHLLLIADYMTFSGQFAPLNRKGMENSSSPLHQLSFESSLAFLKTAAIRGKMDKLESPSSCLMVGKPCNTGTGSFTLLQKIQPLSM